MPDDRLPEKRLALVLPAVPVVDMLYRRRDPEEKLNLRAAFHARDRAAFLKDLARRYAGRLESAGFGPADRAALADGRAPRGYQVHHIRPLDDGGTNDFGNLVLVRAHPEHEAIHRYLDPQLDQLKPGQARRVRLPMPMAGLLHVPDRTVRPARDPLRLALVAQRQR